MFKHFASRATSKTKALILLLTVLLASVLHTRQAVAQPAISIAPTQACVGQQLTASINSNGHGTPISIEWKLNGTVVSISPATYGSGVTVATFTSPSGIDVDGNGNLYVSDLDENRVYKFKPGIPGSTTVAGGNGKGDAANQLSSPGDVDVDDAGNVYVADGDNHRIQKWAPGSTAGITVAGGNGGGKAANQLNFPLGVYADNAGNVYVADYVNCRVQLWTQGATSGITVAGDASGNGCGVQPGFLYYPEGLHVSNSVNNNGSIYIGSPYGQHVRRWSPGATSGVTVASGLAYPVDLFLDRNDFLYVADRGSSRIVRFMPGNIQGTEVVSTSFPTGVALDKTGNLFVISGGSSSSGIMQFSPTGVVSTYTPETPGNYTATLTTSDGSTATSNVAVVNDNVWTGNSSTDWNTAANWSCNFVPPAGVDVTIPSTANPPSLTDNITVRNLSLQGNVRLNGQTLTINGAVSGPGFFIGSNTSSIVINGNAGFLNFSPIAAILYSLTINATGVATIPAGTLIISP